MHYFIWQKSKKITEDFYEKEKTKTGSASSASNNNLMWWHFGDEGDPF